MKRYKYLDVIYKNNTIVFKLFLFVISCFLVVYMMPKQGNFKYEYVLGKPWQYENLYAPFDFSITKSEKEISKERSEVKEQSNLYFSRNTSVKDSVFRLSVSRIAKIPDSIVSNFQKKILLDKVEKTLAVIYKVGYVKPFLGINQIQENDLIKVKEGNFVKEALFKTVVKYSDLSTLIEENVFEDENSFLNGYLFTIYSEVLSPNLYFDKEFTNSELESKLSKLSLTKGKVTKGELLVFKGDIIEDETYRVLESFKSSLKSKLWSESSYNWVVFGYSILTSMVLVLLFLFLKVYRPEIYNNNTKLFFLIFNFVLVFSLQALLVTYNSYYLYVFPLVILPIIIKSFFDGRLALFVHILVVLLVAFVVPDSFEFVYLNVIVGIVTVLSVSELYNRASLFISIFQITLCYIIAFLAFSILKEGGIQSIPFDKLVLFLTNGLLSFLSIFFIYMYEKIFSFISDVTLLELSNTNSKLLRELNEKAPGTFQHSMQVANLAEAAANEIGADSMLVRVGALYHDIGKMIDSQYFIENQQTDVNPHNELSPRDSARIILDHVINGIELAKKNKLPDEIIDFIRTHHGTSLVHYFYNKELENNFIDEVDIDDFKYNGPIPFSKETAILMMCDASEAASKSLKSPTSQSISDLIDKVIDKQQKDKQFVNSDITFRDIEKIKKVIKKKLLNIYHLRIEYPD